MTLQKYILNADGQPQPMDDLLTWAQWMGTGDNKIVRRDDVGPYRVVTTFLGMDQYPHEGDDPFLWDTMVYGGKFDRECERYASKADAEAGHARMVQRVRDGS